MCFQLRSWNFWAVMAALASHGESACFLIFLVGVSNGRRTVTAWAGMWVGKSVCSAHCKQKIAVVNHRDQCTAMLPSISIWLTLTRYRWIYMGDCCCKYQVRFFHHRCAGFFGVRIIIIFKDFEFAKSKRWVKYLWGRIYMLRYTNVDVWDSSQSVLHWPYLERHLYQSTS